MILENLTVTDFRVFQGQHSFDLSPRKKRDSRQPIILFGGLNGAGKTTILTAVQLALYGRQSLGNGTAQKSYEAYLKNSIHKSREAILQASHAAIELSFSYAQLGVLSHFKVKRAWSTTGKKVTESLLIFQDGELVPNLTYEQCQGFLNELVPIGVSELFFFDGEKIKQLAEDGTGTALAESIKKLLGLDIIDRLSADLTVLLRNQDKAKASSKSKAQIEALEHELSSLEAQVEEEISAYEQTKIEHQHLSSEFDRLNSEINAKGGAWAISREEELKKQAELTGERQALEEQIREILTGSYPLSLAASFSARVIEQLKAEADSKRAELTASSVKQRLESLKNTLSNILEGKPRDAAMAALEAEIVATISSDNKCPLIHDLSDSLHTRIEAVLRDAIDKQKPHLHLLREKLKALNEKLDAAGKNIARAPDAETLTEDFNLIKEKQETINKSSARMEAHREHAKRHLRNSMDVARKLEALHQEVAKLDNSDRMTVYAENSRKLLVDFSKEVTAAKVKDLEKEFSHSFQRLARKDDVSLSASIDPKTFHVDLIGANGGVINKNDLSAGEKQIYAISVLEALARTSGRKLPIIIDTPLGRLDSKHRRKLVDNYFPFASHQVLILSTDTEVDEQFYTDLNKHMSHAFKLEYDAASGSTNAAEGYFWKTEAIAD